MLVAGPAECTSAKDTKPSIHRFLEVCCKLIALLLLRRLIFFIALVRYVLRSSVLVV